MPQLSFKTEVSIYLTENTHIYICHIKLNVHKTTIIITIKMGLISADNNEPHTYHS